ncbi:MAG TPA: type II secretion system protein GspM [Magnetospirillaceae bacterium]
MSLPVRRAIALALPLVLVMAAYSAIVKPVLHSVAADRADRAELTDALNRYQQRAERLSALEKEITALPQGGAQAEGYLPGDSEALAGAALQERLKTLVAQWHGQLTSIQLMPAKAEGKALRLAARGEITLNTNALLHVLYAIESQTPYLFVDTLTIHAMAPSGRAAQAEADVPLSVQFDVSGYMRGAE